MNPVRLAIVDDSSFVRKAIQRMLESESRICIVGAAASGEELLENLERWRPEVITLDLSMPGMGGLITLTHIMEWRRVPVIILSTHSQKDAPMAIEALHRGALDFIDKQSYSLMDFQALRGILVGKILSVAHGVAPAGAPAPRGEPDPGARPAAQPTAAVSPLVDALVIGASTGGPPAIQSLLESLGGGWEVPVAIVQHMPEGFTRAFADRLNAHMPFPVQEARHGERFLRGRVYIGPSGLHLRLRRDPDGVSLTLARYPETLGHRPAVDILFESAAHVYGPRALGVLLTGMGTDGAKGMVALAESGAHTIAQDEASCVVYGMPKAAVEAGAAREVLPLSRIGPRMKEIARG